MCSRLPELVSFQQAAPVALRRQFLVSFAQAGQVAPLFTVANEENHKDKSGKRGNPSPCEMPAGEPATANSGLQDWSLIGRRKRKRNDLPASWTIGKMRECLLLLMRGQRVLDEGAELVRVWMLP